VILLKSKKVGLTKKEVETVLDLLERCDEDQAYFFAGFLDAHKFTIEKR
jgi:hypothetical protein